VSDAAPLPSSAAVARLLWEACRRHVDREAVRAAAAACGPRLEAAVGPAVDQRLGPLLGRALRLAGWRVPDELGALAAVQRAEAQLVLPRALRLALDPLGDAGLEPVVMKGPAVAARYPEPGLRPMEDIDVLLPRPFHGRALEALRGAGWRVARPRAGGHYDTVLCHRAVPLALELHHGLQSWYERAHTLGPDELWARRVPDARLGGAAWGLPLEHEIVLLAAHAGKPHHGFARMVWIADLAMVVGHGPAVDWERVASVARRTRSATVVATALALARRAGVEAPASLFPLPVGGWRRAALERVLDPGWPLERDRVPTFHLRFALADTVWRRAVLLAGSAHEQQSRRRRLAWPVLAAGQATARWRGLRPGRGRRPPDPAPDPRAPDARNPSVLSA